MKLIPDSLNRAISKKTYDLKRVSPHLIFATGIAGAIGGTVLACKATLKLEETLDEIKEDYKNVKGLRDGSMTASSEYTDEDYYKDLGYIYTKGAIKVVKLYGPALLVGGGAIASLIISHMQLTKRNAALLATTVALSDAFAKYRIRIQEEIGKEKEEDIYLEETEERLPIPNLKAPKTPNDWSMYARFFDEANVNWQKNPELNRIFIQCQQNYANHRLRANGHLFLNEVYDSLGMERSQEGQLVGWLWNGDGDNYVDFGLFNESSSRFVNNMERSVLLDFNVDGVICDRI